MCGLGDGRGDAVKPDRWKVNLTAAYVLALGLVAGLSIATHWTLTKVISAQEATAAVVNVSGRQRMLSQRIALLSEELTVTTEAVARMVAVAELEAAIVFMERSHIALTEGNRQRGIPSRMSPTIRAIYFDGLFNLDKEVNAFIGHARRVLEAARADEGLPRNNPDVRYVRKAAHEKLLRLLEHLVTTYERESESEIRFLQNLQLGMLAVILLTLLGEALFIFRPIATRVKEYATRLFQLANTDPLTGCNNRRNFMEIGKREFEGSRRYGRPMSVLMLDLDHFKIVNDTHGHSTGDEVIISLVRASLTTIRSADCLGRLGGEEFAIILPETDTEGAAQVAEKLRVAVTEARVQGPKGLVHFTVSIGVATYSKQDKTVFDIVNRSDEAMYDAKSSGRNCVSARHVVAE